MYTYDVGNVRLMGGGHALVIFVMKNRVRPPSMMHLDAPPPGFELDGIAWLKGNPLGTRMSDMLVDFRQGIWMFDAKQSSGYWRELPSYFKSAFEAFANTSANTCANPGTVY